MKPALPFPFPRLTASLLGAGLWYCVLAGGGQAAEGDLPTAEGVEFFEGKIRPLLSKHCFECHSTQGKKVKGGLLMDSRQDLLKGGDTGPAIVPGEPEKSLFIQAVRHAEDDLKMPKEKLAEHEIAALSEWVRMGAPDPRTGAQSAAAPPSRFDWEKERQHWSYQPVRSPELPRVQDTAWPRNAVDHFILARLEQAGMRPVADASRRTLLRRLTFDITGLPPTPDELAAFVADESPDALERVVDRLLASPQYGERWGRHWMDLVRYADTAGDNSDYPVPQLWRYRNYVIDSFNEDKAFDQFIREQIAGDLLPAASQEQRNRQVIATGYVALSRRFGSVVDRYPQHLTIEDTLDNIGKTFLGLSLSCARCHDHKFDAISQRDYYALYGMFESTRYAFPGIELLKTQKDFVPLVPPEEADCVLAPFREKEEGLQRTLDEASSRRKKLERRKPELDKAIEAALGEERDKLAAESAALNQEIEKVRKKVREAGEAIEEHQKERPSLPDAYAVQDGKSSDARVHLKGEPEKLGDTVPRRWLELFGGQAISEEARQGSGRLQLADWIADPKNPLTARVIANRVWHYHFGSGLVQTPSDFGVRGQQPSHPELLDWLADELVRGGWSLKKLHRTIILSRTYQLDSSDDAAWLAADPDNRLHWRFSRQRLTAEALRDTLLALSGRLDATPLAAPHPFPTPGKWTYTQHHPFRAHYPSDRRSVYLMSSRLTASALAQTFDGADANAPTASRDSSVTTVQALYFLNDSFLHEHADLFAKRILEASPDDEQRLDRAFALALNRAPTPGEKLQFGEFFAAARHRLESAGTPADASARKSWASFARALFRTNEFLYID